MNMNLDIDFKNIRSVEGKKDTGFEEFCCQVFHQKQKELEIPDNSTFYRVRGAGGDGGVEGYWKFPNNDEICIQAKYFLSLDPSKWSQVKNSIKKSKVSHPNLKKFILVFPIDLTDSHKVNETTNRDKFNEIKDNWKDEDKNPGFELEFWGLHELISFLQKNYSLTSFWFDKVPISTELFRSNFENFKSIIHDRYRPEINIPLTKFDHFEFLLQTNEFRTNLENKFNELEDQLHTLEIISQHLPEDISNKLKDNFILLLKYLEISINNLIINLLNNVDLEITKQNVDILVDISKSIYGQKIEPINLTETYNLDEFRRDFDNYYEIISEFNDFITGNKIKINNNRLLFLNGEGGKGKTHLMASIIDNRNQKSLVSLIFDGGQLDLNTTITDTIKKNCNGLTCSDDEFYSALDTLAWLSGQRGVIFIDALDEQKKCKVWQKKLPVFLNQVKKYKHLTVAVSYRTECQNDIFIKTLLDQKELFCTTPGFNNLEVSSLGKIFNAYDVEIPTLPALYPEFYNPLFLILFCQYMKNQNLRQIDKLLESYTNIFEKYLDSINDKICNDLDLDDSKRIVQRAVKEIAEKMFDEEKSYLTREKVENILNRYHYTTEHSQSLVTHLLTSGLINKFKLSQKNEEGIRFSFGRFSDFIIVNNLLDKYLDITNPLESFKEGSKLYHFTHKYLRHGLLNALAVLLPERTNGEFEILDIFEDKTNKHSNPYSEYFFESLKNRNPQFITQESIAHLFEIFEDEQIIEIIIHLAIKKNRVFSAKDLHGYLKNFKLSSRDIFWTTSLSYIYKYQEDNIIEKILHYVWGCDKCIQDKDIAISYAIVLAWFFTSPDRTLRDNATKALVNLFSFNLNIIPSILENFTSVNDSYVVERVYCAAYGAILRNKSKENNDQIKQIIQKTYDLIFKDELPPPNVLIRDYAKNIVEQSIILSLDLNINIKKIKPPYKSKYPRIPSVGTIKKIYNSQNGYCEAKPILKKVSYSVRSGDWGIYVLKPLIHYISEKPEEDFAENLWGKFINKLDLTLQLIAKDIRLIDFEVKKNTIKAREKYFFENETKKIVSDFLECLTEFEKKDLLNILKEYKTEELKKQKRSTYYNRNGIKLLQNAENWILKRVSKLCDYKTFPAKFEDHTPYVGRKSATEERLGKKYQWIALFEFMGYALDKYHYCESKLTNEVVKYDSALHLNLRDIDPSLTTKEFKRSIINPHPLYKAIISPNSDKITLENWCIDKENIPKPIELIEQINNNYYYLNLSTYYQWYSKNSKIYDLYDGKFIDFYWFLKSYLVKKQDFDKLKDFIVEKIFFERWMPEESDYGDFFHGEYPDNLTFQRYCKDSYQWIDETDFRIHKCPVKIIKTSARYFNDNARDNSYRKPAREFLLPSPILIKEMDLKYGGKDCNYYNGNNESVIINPYIERNGDDSLFVKKELFIDFLKQNDYEIFWTIGGEKRVDHGKVDISGFYHLVNGEVKGNLNFSKFETFPSAR